jgi:hypothetical protein
MTRRVADLCEMVGQYGGFGLLDDELHRGRRVELRQPHHEPRTSATISFVVRFDLVRRISRNALGGRLARRSRPWPESNSSTSFGGGAITAATDPWLVIKIVSPSATRRSTCALFFRSSR